MKSLIASIMGAISQKSRNLGFFAKVLACLCLFSFSAKAFYMEAALPLYVYPKASETNWTRMFNAGGSKVGFVVANVNNGPDRAVNYRWTQAISNSVSRGIAVYGYLYTGYGSRSPAEVEADIKAWLTLYPQISGFFVDETATSLAKLNYYGALYNYIKAISPNLIVVINPGTVTPEQYMAACDVNVLFESSYSDWKKKTFPTWMRNYAEDRFYAIVFNVPTSQDMANVVKRAALANFGEIFVTDKSTASAPLPAYFETELEVIAQFRSQP